MSDVQRIETQQTNIYYIRIALALVLIATFCIELVMNYGYRNSSDDIGLYATMLQVVESDKYEEQRPYISEATDYGTVAHDFMRHFRESFKANYSGILAGLAAYRFFMFSDAITDVREHAVYTHHAHMSVHYTFFALCIGLFFMTVLRSKDSAILIPAIFLFGLLTMFMLAPTHIWFFGQARDLFHLIARGIIFLLFTNKDFDIFAASPRSIATFLIFTAFLLRFDNRHNLAYSIVGIAVLFHALYTLLCILVFLLLDAAFRPKFLQKNYTVFLTTAMASIATLVTANVWNFASLNYTLLLYIPLCIFGLSQRDWCVDFFRKIFRTEKWFAGNALYAEFSCIFIIVILSWVISFVSYLIFHNQLEHIFTTAEIAPRFTGLFRPVLLYAFIYVLYKKYCSINLTIPMKRALISAIMFAFLSIFYISGSIAYYESLNAMNLGVKMYEQIYVNCDLFEIPMTTDRYVSCIIDGVCHEPWTEVCPLKTEKTQ